MFWPGSLHSLFPVEQLRDFYPESMNMPVQPMLLCFSYADRSHADDDQCEGKARVLSGENRLALLRNRDEVACAGYPLRHALQAKAINCCPISSLVRRSSLQGVQMAEYCSA